MVVQEKISEILTRTIPVDSFEELVEFVNEHRDTLNEYFIKRLEKAIRLDADQIFLFNVGEAQSVYKREEYIRTLTELEKYFVETEQYERVKKCHELADLHKINNIIRLSKDK